MRCSVGSDDPASSRPRPLSSPEAAAMEAAETDSMAAEEQEAHPEAEASSLVV